MKGLVFGEQIYKLSWSWDVLNINVAKKKEPRSLDRLIV